MGKGVPVIAMSGEPLAAELAAHPGVHDWLEKPFDGRTLLAQQVEAQLRAHFGEKVFWTVIPRNVRLAEAPSFGKTIAQHAPTSPGAHAYRRLAEEVMARVQEA